MAFDYDAQIKKLMKYPYRILIDWRKGIGLFQYANETGKENDNFNCGCLTQIRLFEDIGVYIDGELNSELTEQIKQDKRLPDRSANINTENLPVFKKWQLKLDEYRK